MFIVATIQTSLEKILVPFEWIDGIPLSEMANFGLNSDTKLLAFHSPDAAKPPDFSAEIRHKFDGQRDACYWVHINGFFRKLCAQYLYPSISN